MRPDDPAIPEDLDRFWQETFAEAESQPLDMSRTFRDEQRSETHVVERFRFRGMEGRTLHGWVAYPPGARRYPAFLWVPPYGRWSMQPNRYGTRPLYVSLSLNFHGEGSFHEETYTPARGYFAEGLDSPETFIFRRMAQDAVIALRLLEALDEVDETRLAAMGMSQGAGIALWLGAYQKRVRAVAASMPFLANMRWVLAGQKVYRYPLKELTDAMDAHPMGRELGLHTLSYFDTVHVATRCQVPTHLISGKKDPAVRPEQVRAVFDALPGPKELVEIDWGHDWHPQMIDDHSAWLDRWLGR